MDYITDSVWDEASTMLLDPLSSWHFGSEEEDNSEQSEVDDCSFEGRSGHFDWAEETEGPHADMGHAMEQPQDLVASAAFTKLR
jgi:hypothetical protein